MGVVEIKSAGLCASRRPALRCLQQLHQQIVAQPGEKSIIAVVKKGAFTVVAAAGMRQRKKRVAEMFFQRAT